MGEGDTTIRKARKEKSKLCMVEGEGKCLELNY
jgi:hypothetical protein